MEEVDRVAFFRVMIFVPYLFLRPMYRLQSMDRLKTPINLCLHLRLCLIYSALMPVIGSHKIEEMPDRSRLVILRPTWRYDRWTWTTDEPLATSPAIKRLHVCTYLIPNSWIRDVVTYHVSIVPNIKNSLRLTSFKIANMYNDTLKLVCAWSFQFKVLLKVLIPRTVCVWIHLELQGKRNFGIDLGRNAVELLEALEWLH